MDVTVQGEAIRMKILHYLIDYKDMYGYMPSRREIEKYVGRATSVVQHHLQVLEDQGKIRMVPRKARAIQVLEQPDGD